MQWDPQAVRAALAAPGEKTSRRLLSELCEDFRREKPEEWKRIEAASLPTWVPASSFEIPKSMQSCSVREMNRDGSFSVYS